MSEILGGGPASVTTALRGDALTSHVQPLAVLGAAAALFGADELEIEQIGDLDDVPETERPMALVVAASKLGDDPLEALLRLRDRAPTAKCVFLLDADERSSQLLSWWGPVLHMPFERSLVAAALHRAAAIAAMSSEALWLRQTGRMRRPR